MSGINNKMYSNDINSSKRNKHSKPSTEQPKYVEDNEVKPPLKKDSGKVNEQQN